MSTDPGPRQLSPLAALVRFFALHRTAGNLLLMIALLAGALGLMRLNSQFFPTIDFPIITVKVSWPGASAEDMEKTVVRNLEPALSRVEGLDDLLGIAREGRATMTLRFTEGYDMQKALADVKQAVDGVTTLPADAEEPVIKRAVRFELVAKLLIAGRLSEARLKRLARDIRDRLLDAGIARVTLRGARPEEFRVTVPSLQMIRLDLDLDRIAALLRAETTDTPAGDVAGGVEKSVRRVASGRAAADLARVVIASEPLGGRTRLGDVATVRDGYDEQAPRLYAGRRRAIELSIWRTPEADTLQTTALFERELKKIRATLPATVTATAFDVRARYLRDRINLLLKNGAQGLVLVLVILFIFLNGRVAFWVAAGIPVALMATMAAMWVSGQTINMISLFALIMTLGIIVDDAIVVGEHTATLRSRGLAPAQAAEQGALRMLAPVLAAILTTIAAFIPLFFFEGRIGAIIIALPMVVIAVLVASLVECFLILPMHLRHSLKRAGAPGRRRRRFDAAFARFRDGAFARLAAFSYDWRYALWAAMILALAVALALPFSGRLRFNFFPSPESEFLTARIIMAAGTPEKETLKAVEAVRRALRRVERRLGKGDKLVRATVASVGQAGRSNGNHLARLDVQLTGSEERRVRTRRLLHAWRRALPPIPGAERISLGRRFHGGAVNDLEIVLKGDEPARLKTAAQEIIAILKRVKGLTNIAD
ncbi:MAG TPA: efflux RND transporter permease subunit, partial [Thermopetrobacter sp.]|nr:efflux RND transporter permease subunit [Thermopetrobacter sp.]